MRLFVVSLSALVAACSLIYAVDTDSFSGNAPPTDDAALDAPRYDADAMDGTTSSDASAAGPCSEPGLVLRYRFDEGEGTTTNDCSTTAARGNLTSTSWSEGVAGKALSFDGGWVSVGNPQPLQLTTVFTVMAWSYCTQFPAADPAVGYIIGKTADPQKNGWRLGVSAGQKLNLSIFGPRDGGSGAQAFLIGNGVVAALVWTHVAATYEAGASKLYINGNVVATGDLPYVVVNSTAEVRVGGRADGLYPFAGMLDDVRLYDRLLSQQEISAIVQQRGVP